MKRMIGKKQTTENRVWIDATNQIEELVSYEELDAITTSTLEEIKNMVSGKKAAYAWSGGKDSIVLAHLCEAVDVKDSMIGICDLEYPAFADWIAENKPEGCEVINTHQNMDWLAMHPEMLFPKNASITAKWYSIVQHRAQRTFFKNRKLDMIILGRRRADGNFVGRNTNIYTDGNGVTRYSPLAAWSHEHILAYIHYHHLELPPIYNWKNGYLCGTHPWPSRMYMQSVSQGWQEVYEIDKSIVTYAAGWFESAAQFLDSVSSQ